MAFKAINWTPSEKIGESKMDQMATNAEWLFTHTPRAIYTVSGITREQGVKMSAGRILIGANESDTATATVRFGNFFSTSCEPLITTGVVSSGHFRVFCVHHGIGRLHPDHRGFTVKVNIAAENEKRDRIIRSFYVAWQAMGF